MKESEIAIIGPNSANNPEIEGIEDRKADLISVRPIGETKRESIEAIEKELKAGGLQVERISIGSTQPSGSTLFSIYLKR